MTTVLESAGIKILSLVRDRRLAVAAQEEATYLGIVFDTAKGRELTEKECEIIRDLDQFELDVALVKQRLEWGEILDTEPALKAEREAINQQMLKGRVAFEKFQTEHLAKQKERLAEIARVNVQLNLCNSARRQLRETAIISPRETELRAQLKSLCDQERELSYELDPNSSTRNVATFLKQCSAEQRPHVKRRYDATAARHAEVKKKIVELQAEREQLDKLKLLP